MPAESLQTIDARRHDLIRAWRVFPDGDFQKTINAAETDDLAWLIERIDEQLVSTPQYVKDPALLEQSMKSHRHGRSVVASTLGNKRTIDSKSASARIELRANVALVMSGLGVLLAIAALIVSLIIR